MTINDDASELVRLLAEHQLRLVLAESCTGGLVSAELTKVPGVSEWFCGSAVTYRNDTKIRWLGVDPDDIDRHTAVSHQVAEQMASGVLYKTPEADLAAAITGHFGPQAPDGFDGLVFIGTARRQSGQITSAATRHRLRTKGRRERQSEAAQLVVESLIREIANPAR